MDMKKNSANKKRFEILDTARGFAIFLMFVFHFSYDLNEYGVIRQNFNHDPFWLNFRLVIVTLFLTIVGISLYLATYQGLNKKHFRKRLLFLLGYSALVSLGSWLMYPQAMIFFGILHFICVASVVGLLFVHLGVLNLFLGTALVLLSQFVSHPFFDQPAMQWFGLMTHLPITVDYVPMLPWFGVVLLGIYLGQCLTRLQPQSLLVRWQNRHAVSKLLALGGRYSLHIYMLHQPLFLGILYIIYKLL